MERSKQSKPTILVTNAGLGSAIAIIRSLGRKGWQVVAADSDRASPGFRSRYAHQTLLYPPPESAPQEMVDALLEGARKHDVDLIIPATDAVILPLSEQRARFAEVCRLALPEADSLAMASNKLATVHLAQRLGVPVPKTHLVETVDQALERASEMSWPVVLKPQVSRLYRDRQAVETYTVCYAENRDHLAVQMKRFEGRCAVLLQEYTAGEGHGVELLMDHGRPLAAFQHKRLREIPITGGASSLRQSVAIDPVLYEYSVELLSAMNWTGLAMVEFKVGPAGPKLMEINGRVWGSLPLAVFCGMDFPARLARLWLEGAPAPETATDVSYQVGVRARNLELDMVWIASVLLGRRRFPFLPMPKRRSAVAALAGLLNPACRQDIFSWADPRPGLAELVKIVLKFNEKRKLA